MLLSKGHRIALFGGISTALLVEEGAVGAGAESVGREPLSRRCTESDAPPRMPLSDCSSIATGRAVRNSTRREEEEEEVEEEKEGDWEGVAAYGEALKLD